MKKLILLTVSHLVIALFGFALGIYLLPILTAPPSPSESEVIAATQSAMYTGKFQKDLKGSDFLHWGEGDISVGKEQIVFHGKIAPGPDYKLYLSPEFVEDEAQFNAVKSRMIKIGDIKTFENFIISLSASAMPEKYNTAVVWCETFGEFITAAQYQ